MQLDRTARGFSYSADAPLDMRIDPDAELTTAEVINTYDERTLARVLREFGEERFAGRIAAQIVTGIGFLGAGAIIRQGLSIRGLTTAASLWVVAAIGIATGAGYYSGAVIANSTAVAPCSWVSNFAHLIGFAPSAERST